MQYTPPLQKSRRQFGGGAASSDRLEAPTHLPGGLEASVLHESAYRRAHSSRSSRTRARTRRRSNTSSSSLRRVADMSESIPSARGAGKRRADPHAERTPETADVARVERDRAAGDGSPPPKRKSRLADAVAEASGASSDQNAAGSSSSSPGSAIKRAAGRYSSDPHFRRV